MAEEGILLSSGTNEVEIAEFRLGDQSFGINVAKVREFVPYDSRRVTRLPHSPPAMLGVLTLRGRTIPLIDLRIHLDLPRTETAARQVVVVTEFNNLTNGFLADQIDRIHRLSWEEFKPVSQMLGGQGAEVTGTIQADDRQVLVLDFEHIIGQLFPRTVAKYEEDQAPAAPADSPLKREEVNIYLAEDSGLIRGHMVRALKAAGYGNVTAFENGALAHEAIVALAARAKTEGRPITAHLNLVVTDIEMPRLDGLTLCKRIKSDPGLKFIPVVVFSSLINEEMARKCVSVGANAHLSKPDTKDLVSIIDRLVLKEDRIKA